VDLAKIIGTKDTPAVLLMHSKSDSSGQDFHSQGFAAEDMLLKKLSFDELTAFGIENRMT
jgi:hypothetical protein